MRIKALIGVAFLLGFALSGCAAPPSLRSVVYERISPTARVLEPPGVARWRSYSYRLAPGMIMNAPASEAANPLTRTAGRIGEVDACYQTIFTLKQTPRLRSMESSVHAPYDIKLLIGSIFSNQAALAAFRDKPDLQELPENALAWIRQVDYDITQLRVYEASQQQIEDAIKNIKENKLRKCTIEMLPFRSMIVRRIYVGHVKTFVRWDKGYRVALGPWASRIQNSLRYTVDDRGVVFAVETDPWGLF